MDFKKIDIVPHSNGKKYFKLKDLRLGEKFCLLLNKFNTPLEREVNFQGTTFMSYAIVGIHAGEEVMVNITSNLSRMLNEGSYDVGVTVVFEAVKSDKSASGKMYLMTAEPKTKSGDISPAEVISSQKIIKLAGDSGVAREDIDYLLVKETLEELKDANDAWNVFSAI